jgi:hypothetical protein
MSRKIAIAFFSLLMSTGAMAECAKPTPPEVMDGAKSEISAFLSRHKEMSAYQASVATYQECLAGMEQKEMEAGTLTEERAQSLVDQSNAAVGEAEVVAAEHNEQVRVMLARDDYKEYAASQKK